MYVRSGDWQRDARAGWKVVFTLPRRVTPWGCRATNPEARNERMFESLTQYALKHRTGGPGCCFVPPCLPGVRFGQQDGSSVTAFGPPGAGQRESHAHLWLNDAVAHLACAGSEVCP